MNIINLNVYFNFKDPQFENTCSCACLWGSPDPTLRTSDSISGFLKVDSSQGRFEFLYLWGLNDSVHMDPNGSIVAYRLVPFVHFKGRPWNLEV